MLFFLLALILITILFPGLFRLLSLLVIVLGAMAAISMPSFANQYSIPGINENTLKSDYRCTESAGALLAAAILRDSGISPQQAYKRLSHPESSQENGLDIPNRQIKNAINLVYFDSHLQFVAPKQISSSFLSACKHIKQSDSYQSNTKIRHWKPLK